MTSPSTRILALSEGSTKVIKSICELFEDISKPFRDASTLSNLKKNVQGLLFETLFLLGSLLKDVVN